AATEVTGHKPVVVIGHQGDAVRQALGDSADFAWQHEQLGTGHAVLAAREALASADIVLVLYGDTPFVRPETLRRLLEQHIQAKAQVSPLTVMADDSMGFGHIVRNADGEIIGVVEEAVARAEQLQLKELNCCIYCFEAA